MARRLTTKGAERRRALVEVATTRFAAEGIRATSVASIVGDLGVGKGVFYWYFDSKEDLVRQILRDGYAGMQAVQRDSVANEHDPLRRMEAGIRATFRWLAEHRALWRVLEHARFDETFAPLVRSGEEHLAASALPHVRAGVEAGFFRREDPEVLTTAILGVTGVLARTYVLEAPDDATALARAETVAESAIAFCRSGVANPAE